MPKMIFVNLPVADVAKATAFYEAIGFEKNADVQQRAGVVDGVVRHDPRDAARHGLLRDLHAEADRRRHDHQRRAARPVVRQPAEVDAITEAAIAAGGARTARAGGSWASCTAARSRISTATAGDRSGWTRRQPPSRRPARRSVMSPIADRDARRDRASRDAELTERTMKPTITAFDWVPDFAKGQVRDLRVRWALEEVGQAYDVRYLSQGEQKAPPHRACQPFGQVPTYEDGDLTLFESGAIVLHIAETHDGLLPADPRRARARDRMDVRRAQHRRAADHGPCDRHAVRGRQAVVEAAPARRSMARIDERLGELSRAAGRQRLARRRHLHRGRPADGGGAAHPARRVGARDIPNLAAYVARGEARPAFERALRRPDGRVHRQPAARDSRRGSRSRSSPRRDAHDLCRRLRRSRCRPPTRTPISSMPSEFAADVRASSASRRMVEMLGRRRARRQGHRFRGGGAGEGRRDDRVQLVRISRQGDPRRRQAR